MENSNISVKSKSSGNSNPNKIQIISSKDESSFLLSLWEKFTNIFKSNNEEEVRVYEPKDSLRKQLCKCPKTKSRDYCDNIHILLQMTKNNIINYLIINKIYAFNSLLNSGFIIFKIIG